MDKHKNLQPSLKSVLPRPRLTSILGKKKVILVIGRAGQGKSTLIADFLGVENHPAIWYNLDESDKDPQCFFSSLTGKISAEYGFPSPRKGHRDASGTFDPNQAGMSILEILSEIPVTPLYLVLNGFHHIAESPESCRIMEILINNLVDRARLCVLSRQECTLSLANVRRQKELLELRDNELSLTRDEIDNLFRQVYDITLTRREIDSVFSYASGWVTPVVFLAERLSRTENTERHSFLASLEEMPLLPEIEEFIEKEVYDPLSPGEKEALIRLVLADQFNEAMVSALVKDGDGLIENLLRRHLFLEPATGMENTYHFHPLVSLFLKERSDKLEEPVRTGMFTTLGNYFLQNENYHKAVHCFALGENIEKARELLIERSEEYFRDGHFDAIRKLLKEFPQDIIADDPFLSFYEAVALNMARPHSSRERLLELREYFHQVGDLEKEAMIFTVLLTNHFFYQTNREILVKISDAASAFLKENRGKLSSERQALLEALIPMGQWWTGIAKDQAFENALRAEEASYETHNEEAFICARLVLAEIYMARGDFIQARDLIRKTDTLMAEYGEDTHPGPYRYLLAFYLADNYFYLGKLNTAITEIQTVLANMSKDFAFRPYLEVDLVLYYLYQENIGKAEVLYESLRDKDIGENLFLKYFIMFNLQMLMAYRNRDKHRAAYYCKRVMEEESRPMLYTDYPYSFVALVEVNLYLGQYEETQNLLSSLLEEVSENDYPYSYATAMALYGLLETRRGNRKQAEVHFAVVRRVLEGKQFLNLDICDPEVLKEIGDYSGIDLFRSFPRLQTDKHEDLFSSKDFPLEITTLGDFKVFSGGKEIMINQLSSQRRVMDLLKLLIVFRKNGVMKEKIYELFWPRYSYKSARDNLNTIIYRLRKTLDDKADFLYTDVNTIRFREGVCITDLDKFQKYLEMARDAEKNRNTEPAVSLYSQAVELYRGDFLEGDLYYDFIRDERESLKNRYKTALFQLAKLTLSSGDYLESLNWSKKIIEKDPLCEPAYRLLMIASALTGNRSEIPRLYDRLNSKLLEYYRVTSDEKTASLKNRLIEGLTPDEALWKDEAII
ncbi:MAG: hypothetical protein JW760_12035 [Spirochaetales bacterium]|nr:hypothetical protein [Spirochaetales bacterium]